MTQANALETFDFVELLSMLCKGGKTGALHVERDRREFSVYLKEGRVRQMEGGELSGPAAMAEILRDPRGRFHFENDERAPAPDLDLAHETFALEALKLLPPPPLKFPGIGRLEAPERFAELNLSLHEHEIVQAVGAGQPLSELARHPDAAALLGRLCRLRLITERKTRVARLVVQVTQQVSGVVVVDETIYKRWRDTEAAPVKQVQLRHEQSGKVHQLPVRPAPNIGSFILLPPELMIRTGLKAGESVLVRPG
ncbi:DUF4388 domain-containing protein [Deinococcus sp.]|uniref:DUF4388 domain-containing protein n=1 Tax=Deinococcus sp. TaxID=47478 RepID=UPI0025DE9461|nr:DUF4388 domain-containing protein [Deinococcus sp.]